MGRKQLILGLTGGLLLSTALVVTPAQAQSFGGFPTVTKQEQLKKQQEANKKNKKEEEVIAPDYIVVDSRSRGTTSYTSIQRAIDDIATGGVIVVLPGDYRENLNISKAVNIQGDRGPGGRVRIMPTDGSKPCLSYDPVTQSAHTLVSNVEFSTTQMSQSSRFSYTNADELSSAEALNTSKLTNISSVDTPCIAIKSGVFTMKETTVDGANSHTGPMVEITGGTSFLEKNEIRGGRKGVLVNQTHPLWDRAMLVDNAITDNTFDGLHLVGVSSMLVTGNVINKNGQGIRYDGEGQATLVGNKILNNNGDGVILDRKAKQVLLRLNQIWANDGDGVKIFRSNGLIEDNDIDGNRGVEINTLELIGNEPKIINDVPVNAKSYRDRRRR